MTKSDFQNQLRSMTLAQQDFILSQLINKIYQQPAEYGLSESGILKVGDKFIFSKLFEDEKEIEVLFKKAKETIAPGSAREANILANNKKIADWVKGHPGEKLTNDKVAEILDTELKADSVQGFAGPKEDLGTDMPAEFQPKNPKIGMIDKMPPPKPEANPEDLAQKEITEAKARLAELESQKNPNLERTLASDSRIAANQAEINFAINKAYDSGVDKIFGKKGFFGVGRVKGIDAPEYTNFIKNVTAKDVMLYLAGETERSKLPGNKIQILETPQVQAYILEMKHLMDQAEAAISANGNESPEKFMKRLIEFVTIRKPQLEQVSLKKAA